MTKAEKIHPFWLFRKEIKQGAWRSGVIWREVKGPVIAEADFLLLGKLSVMMMLLWARAPPLIWLLNLTPRQHKMEIELKSGGNLSEERDYFRVVGGCWLLLGVWENHVNAVVGTNLGQKAYRRLTVLSINWGHCRINFLADGSTRLWIDYTYTHTHMNTHTHTHTHINTRSCFMNIRMHSRSE